MTIKVLKSLFNPDLVNKIPLGCRARSGNGCGANSEAWVWMYLKVLLTTLGDEDDAFAVVNSVQASFIAFPNPPK